MTENILNNCIQCYLYFLCFRRDIFHIVFLFYVSKQINFLKCICSKTSTGNLHHELFEQGKALLLSGRGTAALPESKLKDLLVVLHYF